MTESTDPPVVRKWQHGYEVPVQITSTTVDGRTVYTYERIIVTSLSALDIKAAVDRDFNGDPAIYAEAEAAARTALGAADPATVDTIVTVLADALGVTL